MEHNRNVGEPCNYKLKFPRHTEKPSACHTDARRKRMPQSIAQSLYYASQQQNAHLKEIKNLLISEQGEQKCTFKRNREPFHK